MVLKNRYVPELLTSYLNLLYLNQDFEQCLGIMDYITDKQEGEDMNVDLDPIQIRRSGAVPSSQRPLSLKAYLSTKALHAIDRQLSDVMSQDMDIVEYLLN